MKSHTNTFMKRPPLVNVVILTREFRFIERCIQKLIFCNYKNLHIYIVDNGSSPGLFEKFHSKYTYTIQTTFIRSKKHLGFGEGNNLVLRRIKRGYIVFLNDDTFVTKNWLTPIIRFMESHIDVGACQPKIKDYRNKRYFEYAGAAGGFMDVYGFPFCRGRIFFTTEQDRGQYNNMVNVVWCSGSCMVTRSDVIRKVGFYDKIFIFYGEESDLCWRMHFAGYRLVYVPTSVVYHYGSGTMQSQPYKKIYLHHRNGLILLLKNYTASQLVRYLPLRVAFDAVAFWYYLIYNRIPVNAWAVIAAYLSLLGNLPAILSRRRKAAFLKNREPYGYPLYKGSVIIDYFLGRKTKYSQL